MSLPFVTAEAFRQRAVAGDALPALLLLVPVFIMTMIPDQSAPLPAPLAWASLALAAAALPYAMLKYFDASTLAGTLQGSVGIGARLMVMGVLIVLAGLGFGLVLARFRGAATAAFPAEPDSAAFAPAGRPAAGVADRAVPAADPVRAGARWERVPSPRPTGSPSAARVAPDAAAPPARAFPRWKRPATARTAAPAGSSSPAAEAPRTSPRVPPRSRPADPDTEPTLPATRPVQPWWPDDLEDLFS